MSLLVSGLTPLALLFAPGRSDLPRTIGSALTTTVDEEHADLLRTNLVNSIVKCLGELSASEKEQVVLAYRQACSSPLPVTVARVEQGPEPAPQLRPKPRTQLKPRPSHRTGPGRSWAIIVGISRYASPGGTDGLTNLAFADDDARAFYEALLERGWDTDQVKLLLDSDATQRNVIKVVEGWLTKAGPDDLILLYWSGHGFPDPEDPEKVYLACHDTEIEWPATGFRMDRLRDILAERGARNVVVIADTCHAGKLVTRGERGVGGVVTEVKKLEREKSVPKGWVFLVSAETDRKAIEHSSWANGAFTHCLLDAMAGKADGYRGAGAEDGVITVGEIKEYLNTAMPDETQRVLGIAVRPLVTTSTGDPDIWNLTLEAR